MSGPFCGWSKSRIGWFTLWPIYGASQSDKGDEIICLGLNSVCVGSESRFFNGHTNIEDNMFLVFGVKGVMELNKKLRCAIEFNILSYMTHGGTCGAGCHDFAHGICSGTVQRRL